MGYNIAGLIFNTKLTKEDLEAFLDAKTEYINEISLEEATESGRDENTIDILESETGMLVIMELGEMYDLSISTKEAIQFMVSDTSDTYYFEKYSNGELIRKYITTQGEIAEDIGDGIIDTEKDLIDEVWTITNDYLKIDIILNLFSIKLKRYKLL